MIEPLTTSRPGLSFYGKTHNNHPQWYNEPLRLTEEQRNDPTLVLYDFFQCYHLNETRKLLWDWLTEIVSSSRSVSEDPHDRNNQIYFYEKIEQLIEAALLITKSSKLEKREALAQPVVDLNGENEEISRKIKPLIEDVEIDPIYVLKQVFNPDNTFIIDEIKEWLLIALSADSTVYDEAEQRSSLIVVHDHLIVLIEALFVITLQNIDNAELKDKISSSHILTELSQSQLANPKKVIATFFENYSIKLVTKELDNWFEASISYSGEWQNNVICLQQVWDIYRNVQCLIKIAEQLLRS